MTTKRKQDEGPSALDRIRRGDFFFHVSQLGELGDREVRLMAKTPGTPTMLVGISEKVLMAWLLLDDPEEEGFPHPLSIQTAAAAFRPRSGGIRRMYEEAMAEQAEAEAEMGEREGADKGAPEQKEPSTDGDPKGEGADGTPEGEKAGEGPEKPRESPKERPKASASRSSK